MDLPVFALHKVLFPGQGLSLHVFEERYLQMMEEVLPEDPFAIVAIRAGQEVGGPYEPYRVGVSVVPDDFELNGDGTYDVTVRAVSRVRLLEQASREPYPRWRVEPFPEHGEIDRETFARAVGAAVRFLEIAGMSRTFDLPTGDLPAASYTLAAMAPGLVPDRQELLEIPGSEERFRRLTEVFRMEAGLLRALRERRER